MVASFRLSQMLARRTERPELRSRERVNPTVKRYGINLSVGAGIEKT